ncbi:MAG: IMP cyclohydrolase [archaeon]
MVNDFSALQEKVYSGRGIIAGLTPSGKPVMAYSLTGRSPSSQARKLAYDSVSGVIRTDVTDREQLEKGSPALLIYPAMVELDEMIIASNGSQTRIMYDKFKRLTRVKAKVTAERIIRDSFDYNSGFPFMESFEYDPKSQTWINLTSYEPDAPNFTPRINATIKDEEVVFGILKKDEYLSHIPKREFWKFILNPGQGFGLTTYQGGNENPLLPFEGELLEVKLASDSPVEICQDIYEAISHGEKPGENYAVSAAVMIQGQEKGVYIINRNK